jgi:hypothetical protein
LKVNAEADKSNIYLYPNPTRGIVNLHVPVKSDIQAQMRVISMNGKVVRTKQISLKAGIQEFTTDLSGLPDGTYQVILDGPGLKWSGSIIKTK